MTENTQVVAGTGDIIATDDIGGVKYQRVKLIHGADGVNDGDVSEDNHLPIAERYFQPTSTMRDAFGRLRISSPQVLGFGTHEYGLNTSYIETSVNGSGAVANVLNESSLSLTNGGGTSGHYAIVQTRQFHRYIPGRSQLVRWTGSFGTPTANVRQRCGYFSSRNGVFLEYDGTTLYFVRRSYTSGAAVDTRIARSSWDDPMDGTGLSGVNLDLAGGTTWLAWVDLEWLGVGRYRFGFASPSTGELLVCYAAAGTNSLAVPYMTTANLPVRYEIENTGAASAVTMKWICYAVDTEGGDEGQLPIQLSVDSGVTAKALATASSMPVIALRAKTTGPNSVPNRAQIILRAINASVLGNFSAHFRLILNPTTLTANGGAVTWTSGGALAEFATFSAAGDTVAGGTVIDSFNVAAAATVKGSADADIFRRFPLVYTELGSVQDTVVLVGQSIGGASNAYGSLTFQEVY